MAGWVALGTAVLGAASSAIGTSHAEKMAAKQEALAREQAERLRAQAMSTKASLQREIDTMRLMRTLDMPAMQEAAQISFIQAKKGSERMARHRMMGRLAPDVRDAIFGGQFQQYVGREIQRLGKHAALTQQIFTATAEQQSQVNALMSEAVSLEMGGTGVAIQMEAEAGDPWGNILGGFAQAGASYLSGGGNLFGGDGGGDQSVLGAPDNWDNLLPDPNKYAAGRSGQSPTPYSSRYLNSLEDMLKRLDKGSSTSLGG